ncbi:GDA1/CD39 nucleoside phosphatase family protein (macronuclear) [Tetrahymena thermophila SB210]|uniref:GDA1/CD39 nucleoside phosphatase family protein n=1 Tax=Tetrahymena thermophila (strain SB210) TaxID=312017 RepID=Q239L6_TETTS|nr:GDA1/CD39 nucleoside phosphatase family protein [Tetrahymena thermophila SB210]EAR93213.2 GDA1/CD39 nucleoside phosphatase family protein [Tetrahymena thermophila SB210]|eukprot:XP_001013458.2 GDA1/CD39 nucleoside phosphatase family protein [Tetrahymena thermophila SB210]
MKGLSILFFQILMLALRISAIQDRKQKQNQNHMDGNDANYQLKINENNKQDYFMLSKIREDNSSCYSVVFDAGSTGTRYEVFEWNCDQAFVEDQKFIIQSIESSKDKLPISNYESNPEGLISVFEQKFKEIKAILPEEKVSQTDIYLGATEGMRQLSSEKQEAIINQIVIIFQNSGFRFLDSSKARVITGNQEGIFLWIGVNNMISQVSKIQDMLNENTITAIDVGGKSSQIAFLKNFKDVNKNDAQFEYQLSSNQEHVFLVNSEKLGFKIAKMEILKQEFEDQREQNHEKVLFSSCYNKGYEGYEEELSFKIIGQGDPEKCINLIRRFFKLENCEYPKFSDCTEQSSQQNILQVQNNQKIYVVENAMHARVAYGLRDSYTPQKLKKKAIKYCKKPYSQISQNEDIYTHNQCLQGLYVSSLQIDHYGIDPQQTIYSPSQINQWVPSWGIGMLLTELFHQKCNLQNEKQICESLQLLLSNP